MDLESRDVAGDYCQGFPRSLGRGTQRITLPHSRRSHLKSRKLPCKRKTSQQTMFRHGGRCPNLPDLSRIKWQLCQDLHHPFFISGRAIQERVHFFINRAGTCMQGAGFFVLPTCGYRLSISVEYETIKPHSIGFSEMFSPMHSTAKLLERGQDN